MWLKWLPWRFIVRKVARQQGFLDPITILSKFQNFAQPSDVMAPKELMREGVVLHARGLMNSQAIQHNLDWVWPYWAERQFDPKDISFIPRAFSLTQINLTHRNWTAIGLPDCSEYPIVDPRGLLTPYYDGWSLDAWIVTSGKHSLLPSRLQDVEQTLSTQGNCAVITTCVSGPLSLVSRSEMIVQNRVRHAQMAVRGLSQALHLKSWLIISVRPYNPEGVSFIHDIELLEGNKGWRINKKSEVHFDQPADQWAFSYYRHGDVYNRLTSPDDQRKIYCKVGMATAAALFELNHDHPREVTVSVPFKQEEKDSPVFLLSAADEWQKNLDGHCRLEIPDKHFQFLYDAALRTMVLHSPAEVYPGPYTYRRFWFRDAVFILYAMLCVGFIQRVKKAMHLFPLRQQHSGYFLSQEGEWDANGEVLWLIRRFHEMTRLAPDEKVLATVDKAGLWISRKRLPSEPFSAHAGLFPPGFSAEHLGPNDYYYWDNFWGIGGLEAAVYLEERFGNKARAQHFAAEAQDYMQSVEHSLAYTHKRLGRPAMPAAPYRRLDSGAVGSLAAGYPLQIFAARDERLLDTVKYLTDNCLVHGGFFHDMTHSGINPYLTLHMAQVLLRAGDQRYFELMNAVAAFASSTGQWPEAIHPVTKGGCMGDGQHVWAAAEWVLMMRNCFVREEKDKLVFGSGVPPVWLKENTDVFFGPTATSFGPVRVTLRLGTGGHVVVSWEAQWFDRVPDIEVFLPGQEKVIPIPGRCEAVVNIRGKA